MDCDRIQFYADAEPFFFFLLFKKHCTDLGGYLCIWGVLRLAIIHLRQKDQPEENGYKSG